MQNSSQSHGLFPRQPRSQVFQEPLRRVGVRLLFQRVEVGIGPLVQNGPQVPVGHEPLRKQLVPVALDELAHGLPARLLGDVFQHGEADVAAVVQPPLEDRGRHLLEHGQQRRTLAPRPGAARPPLVRPGLRRAGHALHHPLPGKLEEPVKLGDRHGPDGMVPLHAADGLHQAVGFVEQAQPRQGDQQTPQDLLQVPRVEDAVAGCRRGPWADTKGARLPSSLNRAGQAAAYLLRVAAERQAEHLLDCRFASIRRAGAFAGSPWPRPRRGPRRPSPQRRR